MIPRKLELTVKSSLNKGKVVIIYGPRRIGKTTLVRKIMSDSPRADQLYLNSDLLRTQRSLAPESLASLERTIGKAKLVVIDEAQRVENIGLTLKILIDAHPELNIIATGSSSFDLANKIKEPLTGRSIELRLMPLSMAEVKYHFNYQASELEDVYEKLMLYGGYPQIFEMDTGQAEEELQTIASQYTYKDTLELVELRQQQLLPRLLQALAFQMGSEVSFHELGVLLGVKNETIARYVTLLEQSFIVYRLSALTGNQRTQLSNRKRKIYFYDLGIRNALINNFNELSFRQDVGALWESLCVNERQKLHSHNRDFVDMYYWRGLYGEVDLVENQSGSWRAFECKWGEGKFSVPKYFREKFPGIDVELLNPQTLPDFIE